MMAICDKICNDYDAYGNLLQKEGETPNDFMYTGEQYNEATGLYYLRARYMNPTTGTLISEDAYAGKLSDPYTLHKYMYANNNPVKYIDPSGNEATISEYATAEAIMGVLATVTAVAYVRYAYELSQNIRWSGISVWDTVGSTFVDHFKLEAKKPEEAADAARDAGEVVEGEEDNNHKEGSSGYLRGKEADKAAEEHGYTKIKERSHRQPVYKKGKKYITPDVDSHNGGVWKMADSVKNLASKKTRMGTYDANLNRIGD